MTKPAAAHIQHLLISTGDASAAQHVSALVRALKAACPKLRISAVGNDELAAAGADLVAHHDEIGMGGWGLAAALGSVWGHLQLAQKLKRFVQREAVDRVLLVDYAGFHLRLAARLHGLTDLHYYIPPQLWASRAGRMKTIQRHISHVYTIFPFEGPLYEAAGVPHTFVGHPLLNSLPPAVSKAEFSARHGLAANTPLLGVFPGSRRTELQRLLPVFAETCALLQAKLPGLQYVIAQAPNLNAAYVQGAVNQAFEAVGLHSPPVVAQQNHALLSAADCILGASGTTSLEAALYTTPMVIAYKVDALTAAMARRLIRVDYIGLPNLLAPPEQAPILPEHLQEACTAPALAESCAKFLDLDSPARLATLAALGDIKASLGEGVSREAFLNTLVTPITQ